MTADALPFERVHVSTLGSRTLQRAFARIAARRCRPPFAPDCVPFDFQDWGCEVRAHLVCQHLAEDGIVAGKVWLFDRPITEPRPPGARNLTWEWHVAAFVRVSTHRGRAAVRIIDPSFHTRAVTLRTLLRRFHANPRRILFSAAACFQMGPDGRGSPDRRSRRFGRQSQVLLAQLRADALVAAQVDRN